MFKWRPSIANTRLANQRGSSLVYAMMSVVVIGIFSYVMIGSITDLRQQMGKLRNFQNREFSTKQIRNYLALGKSLEQSAVSPLNDALVACIKGGPVGTCTSNCCTGNVAHGFSYISPKDTTIDVASRERLTGPASAPTLYTQNGTLCTTDCAYKLSSSFVAQCPGGEPTCDHAEHVIITVKQDPIGTTSIKAKTFVIPYFNDVNYKPSVTNIPEQNIFLGTSTEKEITVTGYSGHPSEVQNFFFTACESSNTNVFQLVTSPDQPFDGGTAKIKIKGMTAGKATLKLQISDGAGLANNLSDEYLVTVNVFDGVAP